MPPTDQSAEGDATNQQVYRITIRATPQKVWDAFVKEGEVDAARAALAEAGVRERGSTPDGGAEA